ncbi:MAG: tRNA pseudouridine(55) synthase TruB [Actinomycetaceae bacterium]|nr:tRNA pseudouridine(55) synthase TruB [Actinomycetaceae bacterium]
MPWGQLPYPTEGTEPLSGLLCIDKDKGVTSHDIVGAVRRLAGTRKVGHAGTLDPMATGVLCVGIGRATKLLQYVTGTSKEYTATIRFGISTSTDDAEGEIGETAGCASLPLEDLAEHMRALTGDIMQVPSSVSAIKIGGKRAYELAREGKAAQLSARPVTVYAFELCGEPRHGEYEGVPVVDVDVRVECSAGTYIRALARDLGTALGVGAHLTALRRTRVGKWSEEDCASISALAEYVREGKVLPHISLADTCAGLFDVLDISEDEAKRLQHGQFIDKRDMKGIGVAFLHGQPIALLEERKGQLKPSLVF